MDKTGLGLCRMVAFINGIESWSSAVEVLVRKCTYLM
jgi:hypothetical protein